MKCAIHNRMMPYGVYALSYCTCIYFFKDLFIRPKTWETVLVNQKQLSSERKKKVKEKKTMEKKEKGMKNRENYIVDIKFKNVN